MVEQLGEAPTEPQYPKAERRFERTTACPDCGSKQLLRDYSRAELTCGNCGLVVDEDLVDTGPEWSAYDAEQRARRIRTGAPSTLTIHDKGLTTEIDWRTTDARRQQLSPKRQAQMVRLRRMQRRSRVNSTSERNLAFALSEIDRMSSALSLNRNLREQAALYYRKAVDKGIIRGRSIEAVAAATIYAACRKAGISRTFGEIEEVAKVEDIAIQRAYRILNRELGMKLRTPSPMEYVERFCSELHIPEDVRGETLKLLQKAKEKNLIGSNSPDGIAAAAIYIASLLRDVAPPQRELAAVAGVSEVTIRNRYKELARKMDIKEVLYERGIGF